MRSPVYWHPRLYEGAMRLLYGRHYRARYAEIARRVERGASVVDLCCGDCRLYTQELTGLAGSYQGLDFNAGIVRHARKLGIPAELWDFRRDPIPEADVIVLQGSLYQFMPDHVEVIERMLGAARHTVIIAEPVRNLVTGSSGVLSWMAKHMANPGSRPMPTRFTESSLRELFRRFPVRECVPIAGGRELLGVLDPRSRRA
jgi:trans-aconitate methyltransferase